MPAANDRTTLVQALEEVWRSLGELGTELTPEQWDLPTECPGWTVRDVYSHIIGTELMLLGRPDPTVDVPDAPHLRNDIAKFNEGSVELRRDRTGGDVLAEFVAVTHERLDVLRDMDDAAFDEESFTPAGQDTYGRFMQIRVFDCWIHEQDVRVVLEHPGHAHGTAVDVAIDEMSTALGFVFGKKAGATDGQSLRLALTGADERTIDVRVDGRARIVDDLTEPTTTVTIPTLLWFRYAAGRRPGDPTNPHVRIEGDTDLGTRVVEHAAYTL